MPPSTPRSLRSSPRRNSTNHRHDHPRRLLYTALLVGGCYLQIAVNFLVYHHQDGSGTGGATSSWKLLPFGGGKPQQEQQQYLSLDWIHTLSKLETRTGRLLQQQQQAKDDLPYRDDGRFLAFTVRDARRTVPTQILHGFHVFDFVDVHNPATYGFMDGDDEDEIEEAKSQGEEVVVPSEDPYDDDISMSTQPDLDEEPPPEPLQYPLPLFHNGFPVPYPYNTSLVFNATLACQDYSMACYRSNLVQVIRYLLEAPNFRSYSYFFYMESDHNLCVSLSYLRSMAYQNHRYVLSVGSGASGWIMSRAFLQDFYNLYKVDDTTKVADSLPPEDRLRPDVVATALLRHKDQSWSVTRRYMTSHTVLTSTAFGVVDQSLTDLFEYDIDPVIANATNATAATEAVVRALDGVTGNETAKNATTTQANQGGKSKVVELLPPMVPKGHLPRCLEPRRRVRKNREEFDAHADGEDDARTDQATSWDAFDYTECPNSELYPCENDGKMGATKKRLRE